jgi:enamine deaminase RidA (YjgF/YER057c/UK114 family)
MAVPLSPYRTHGDLVFTAGQIGRLPDGSTPADFGGQVRAAMDSLVRVLEDAGASLATVLKVTVFITDDKYFAEMNAIYTEYFGEPFPARSTVIAALVVPELFFEIEAVAHLA